MLYKVMFETSVVEVKFLLKIQSCFLLNSDGGKLQASSSSQKALKC